MKNEWKTANYSWNIAIILIFIIFCIGKAIVKSWFIVNMLIFLIVWVCLYFIFYWIDKFHKNSPASLWKWFKKKYPIITQYEPPKWINPAEAWLLYNRKVDPTDLTSMVYQWKFEKIIDIKTFKWKRWNKEYIKLIKLDDLPFDRPFFESEIFDSLFHSNNVKIIKWAFQLRYALMLDDLEYHWVKKWWIVKSKLSHNWNQIYNCLLFLLFGSIYLYLMEFFYSFPLFWIFVLFLFLVCVFLWWYMECWFGLRFTDKWAKLASQVIGKLFLKEDPLFIDRTLPYATAFGLETQFLKKISPLKKDWNAKYIKWQKLTFWMELLAFFLRPFDNIDKRGGSYGW